MQFGNELKTNHKKKKKNHFLIERDTQFIIQNPCLVAKKLQQIIVILLYHKLHIKHYWLHFPILLCINRYHTHALLSSTSQKPTQKKNKVKKKKKETNGKIKIK